MCKEKKSDYSFKVTIEALDNKSGDIGLDICSQNFYNLQKVLKRIVKNNSILEATNFTLTQISKNSPITATIRIECNNIQATDIIYKDFNRELETISRVDNQDINTIDFHNLENYKKIAQFSIKKSNRYKTTIISNNNETIFDSTVVDNINRLINSQEECLISYEGELEQINLHNEINCFYIYPYAGVDKIKCYFPPELYNEAIDGIGRKVCVTGGAVYNKNSLFPSIINVKEIDLCPVEYELPSWDDLKGIAPNATGELLSEEFIRNLRNEWQ